MESKVPNDQRQVVVWLQTLCHLGVIIPLDILFSMFSAALGCLKPDTEEDHKTTFEVENDLLKSVQILTCMLDVLIVQFKIQVGICLQSN